MEWKCEKFDKLKYKAMCIWLGKKYLKRNWVNTGEINRKFQDMNEIHKHLPKIILLLA